MLTRLPVLIALLVAAPSAAQRAPSAQALLDVWASDWRRAARTVASIEADERLTRSLDGRRGRLVIETESDIRFDRAGGAVRDVRRLRVNGRQRDPADRRVRDRFERAFGPAGREIAAPPLLPGLAFADAEAVGIAADRLGDTAAWRVSIRVGDRLDRMTAWFSQGAVPRLLRMRTEGDRPRGGRYARTVAYDRIGGLDLAVSTETETTIRQRRRLRSYAVVLTASGAYRDIRIVSR
ncbi:MAG: hypothetical protein AAF845_19880 [Bacteroidota bacterium]